MVEGFRTGTTYIVDSQGDTITEANNEGVDTVKSSVTYTLSANLENLELIDGQAINGTGNDLDNKIKGNDQANTLKGNDQANTLKGNAGNDELLGGEGADTLIGGNDRDYLHAGDDSDKDTLEGGQGFDTYVVKDGDIITDSDGSGRVEFNNRTLTGGSRKEDDPENVYKDGGITYVLNGTTLTINGSLTITDFSEGDLGINFKTEEEEEDKEETPDISGPEKLTSPIVIDLDGDGVETQSLGDTFFDLDNDGLSEQTGWVSPDDGLLVRDKNNDGRINNGSELFGNNTSLQDGSLAEHGFQILAELDDNGDGVVDAEDAVFNELKIWQDKNNNGTNDEGEMISLADAGIKAINTASEESSTVDAHGNEHRQVGSIILENGETRTATDVWFKVDAGNRINNADIELTVEVAGLPDAKAFGQVYDLRQAMVGNKVLQALVKQYSESTDAAERSAILDNLIYEWAGVADVDPYSRDPSKIYSHVMDARQLETLEKLVGRSYLGTWCWGERDPNPHGRAAPVLVAEFVKFKTYINAQLMAQTHFADEFSFVKSHFVSGVSKPVIDWSEFENNLNSMLASEQTEKLQAVVDTVQTLGTYSPSFRSEVVSNFGVVALKIPELADFLDVTSYVGTEFADNLSGGNQAEIFYGKKGDDRLFGGRGDDSYRFDLGDGQDVIYDTAGQDKIVFGEGITPERVALSRDISSVWIKLLDENGDLTGDQIQIDNVFNFDGRVSEGLIEEIVFNNGVRWGQSYLLTHLEQTITDDADQVYGSEYADDLAAKGGDDKLFGFAGNDVLKGEGGNDELLGDAGDDQLTGGTGDDQLTGGLGNDTYLFSQGHGQDIINNYDSGTQRNDKIVFDASISREDVTFDRNVNDLLIHTSEQDWIRVNNYFQNSGNNKYTLQAIEFADGQTVSIDDVKAAVLKATDDADSITGYAGDDVIDGQGGNDNLYGNAGDDTLSGGEGADRLYGNAGNDHLKGQEGNDTLYGHDGNDTLEGGAGNDYLYGSYGDDQLSGGEGVDRLYGGTGRDTLNGGEGNDSLYAGTGDDVLTGGKGNDYLSGGVGADDYYFAKGDGQDTIQDDYQDRTRIFVSDLDLDKISFRRVDTSLKILFQDSAEDSITLQSFFQGDTPRSDLTLTKKDGTSQTLDANAINLKTLEATALDDVIQGNDQDNEVSALAGNDRIYGYGGNDTLRGGKGNDLLEGGSGDDHYHFAAGDGQDVIDDSAGIDTLSFDDLNDSDVLLRREEDDLVITSHNNSGDRIVIRNHFTDTAGVVSGNAINFIAFANGVRWTTDDILVQSVKGTDAADQILAHAENDTITALGGDDSVHGQDGNDDISGGDGDDTLYGENGKDTLLGEAGNDHLEGGDHDDRLMGGDGIDTLLGQDGDDFLSGGDQNDDLQGGRGNDQLFGDDGNDTLDGGWGDDTLRGGLGDDQLTDHMGKNTLFGGEGNDRLSGRGELFGNEGDDTLEGSGLLVGGVGHDNITGQAGSTVKGDAGNDTLIINGQSWGRGSLSTLEGGAGDDTLYGGFADDLYLFNLGDGADRLIERRNEQAYTNTKASSDVLRFGEGIAASDLTYARRGDNMVISHSNGSDRITIENWFQEPTEHFKVNRFEFADGTLLTDANLEEQVVTYGTDGNDQKLLGYRDHHDEIHAGAGDDRVWGRAGNDVIHGDGGDDYLDGEDGDDRLFGGEGADNLQGKAGTDHLEGGLGDDSLSGGSGNDTLLGQTGADQLFGGDGDDRMEGGAGNDYMDAGAGDDTLMGGEGKDQLRGQAGNDTLIGGAGQDTYVWAMGDGADVIDNRGGQGLLLLQGGATLESLDFSRDGDDLLISAKGQEGQSIRVQNHFLGGDWALDAVQPDGGFMMSTDKINQLVAGGSDPDFDTVVKGTDNGERLVGNNNKDKILGQGGDDTLFGMSGNDRLEGEGGNDRLIGGNGSGQNSGDDVLLGGAGNDVLNGEDGNDTLDGGAGDDHYYYNVSSTFRKP